MSAIRNCVADPKRTEPVFHPHLPLTAPWSPVCPMRAYQDPEAQRAITLHARVKLWGVLPRAGGLYDQRLDDLMALELVEAVARAPWPGRRSGI